MRRNWMGAEERQDRAKRRKELLTYLRKLAKGKNNDVVKLAFLEPRDLEVVDRLDLTGVAELKRGANGTLEVKFVDRVKVLAMLRELLEQEDGALEEFLEDLGGPEGDEA